MERKRRGTVPYVEPSTRLLPNGCVLTVLEGVIDDAALLSSAKHALPHIAAHRSPWVLDISQAQLRASLRTPLTELAIEIKKHHGAGVVAVILSQMHRTTLSTICLKPGVTFRFAATQADAITDALELQKLLI